MKWFDDILQDLIEEFGEENVFKNIDKLINNSLPKVAQLIRNSLKDLSQDMLDEHRLRRISFESRLLLRWRKPINLLRALQVIALESGEEFCKDSNINVVNDEPDKIKALISIHARACRITDEILCLLRGGFPDAAFARWRTLHELSVLSFFISENDNELSQRYLDYSVIDSYKEMEEYNYHQNTLELEPLDEETIESLKLKRNNLIKKYGKNYIENYGWAANTLSDNHPTFKKIEECVGLDYMRPYYKMACNNIHSGAKGNLYSLGLIKNDGSILLSGSSNYGLADAGQNTAISLQQICTALLMQRKKYEHLVITKVIEIFSHEISEAFVKVQKQIELEEKSVL
jgi:hypothetical protein